MRVLVLSSPLCAPCQSARPGRQIGVVGVTTVWLGRAATCLSSAWRKRGNRLERSRAAQAVTRSPSRPQVTGETFPLLPRRQTPIRPPPIPRTAATHTPQGETCRARHRPLRHSSDQTRSFRAPMGVPSSTCPKGASLSRGGAAQEARAPTEWPFPLVIRLLWARSCLLLCCRAPCRRSLLRLYHEGRSPCSRNYHEGRSSVLLRRRWGLARLLIGAGVGAVEECSLGGVSVVSRCLPLDPRRRRRRASFLLPQPSHQPAPHWPTST
jgi:hypothetical protein